MTDSRTWTYNGKVRIHAKLAHKCGRLNQIIIPVPFEQMAINFNEAY